jgi:hypothetical protein
VNKRGAEVSLSADFEQCETWWADVLRRQVRSNINQRRRGGRFSRSLTSRSAGGCEYAHDETKNRLTTSRLADPAAVHDAGPRASYDTLGISGIVSAFDAAIGVSGVPTDDEAALDPRFLNVRPSNAGENRLRTGVRSARGPMAWLE